MSPPFATFYKDDLPHIEMPSLVTKGPDFVGIDLQALQKHFPYFNFYQFWLIFLSLSSLHNNSAYLQPNSQNHHSIPWVGGVSCCALSLISHCPQVINIPELLYYSIYPDLYLSLN